MRVVVDTSVWSLALRRIAPRRQDEVSELKELIGEGRVVLLGAIRQEILSGVGCEPDFESLRNHLRAFPDEEITTTDHERAATCFNLCRSRGIQGSNTDFLICAVAERRGFSILTTDKDFAVFARVLPIRLQKPR